MALSKKHIEYFAKCVEEEFKKAEKNPVTGTFTAGLEREIFRRAFGRRKRIFVSALPFVFAFSLLLLVLPIIRTLLTESNWFLPIYLGLLLGINIVAILLSPKIIGWLFNEKIKTGCRKFAKDFTEDVDAYLTPESKDP